MSKRSPQDYIEIAMMFLPVVLGIFVLISYIKRPSIGTTFYFVSKEAVQARISPKKIGRFISPGNLTLQKVNDRSTNVIGWVATTNSGGDISTQWFRCRIETARAVETQLFRDNPTSVKPDNR